MAISVGKFTAAVDLVPRGGHYRQVALYKINVLMPDDAH